MKYLLYIAILVFGATALKAQSNSKQVSPPQPQGQHGWAQVPSGTTAPVAIDFISEDTCFAGTGTTFYLSLNGGLSWQGLSWPVPPSTDGFANPQDGYIANAGPSPGCHYAHDGGRTWTSVNDSCGHAVQVVTFGRDTAFVIGDYVTRTTDGGQNWSHRVFENWLGLNGAAFYDSQHGVVVGKLQQGPFPQHQEQTAGCFTTSDGGQTWTQQYMGAITDQLAVCSVASNLMVSVGGRLIERSTDGGLTWALISSSFVDRFHGLLAIVSTQRRIISVGSLGLILSSTDQGLTWEQQSSGITSDLNSIKMFDDTLALAAGDAGVILRTTNGGTDWVQVAPKSPEQLLSRVRYISETPFIEIEYSLPQLQDVTIRLFDLLGKEIETLQTRKLESAGPHRIRLDTSHLPSGTYLYRIETERYSGMGKFVIAR